MDAYDSLPYDSYGFPETHPEQLAALASIHGVNASNPGECSVLELGCASGGNLLPMARMAPSSRFLGVELSGSQLREGQERIARLGLKNIEILHGDVREVALDSQRFDYIIAQGLYSWVPEPVRMAILALIRKHLAPNGIAYLSFNALPGWRMRGMLRDMLCYHIQDETDPAERLLAARELLPFLARGLQDVDALSARYLRHELRHLSEAPDSYLYHEFLAEVNQPFLFADFVRDIRAQGLDYLCNAELQFSFPATVGEQAEQLLAGMPDPVERQQYLDFLLNRNFHQALIIQSECSHLSHPDYERFVQLAFFADLQAKGRMDLRKPKSQTFTNAEGESYDVRHPLTKAALLHLAAAYPAAVPYEALETRARKTVGESGGTRLVDQVDHMFGEIFSLYARRAIQGSPLAGGEPLPPGEHPRANILARLQAEQGYLVDSRHRTLKLDEATARLIALLEGTRERQQLEDQLGSAIKGKRLNTLLDRLARLGVFEPGNGS